MKVRYRTGQSLDMKHFITPLLKWFSRNGRTLPWRETRDPYAIWISEVILQQTQVIRGEIYYKRFLKQFPTLQALAKARWPSLLKAWRGLGYYQRAKNLSLAAKAIVAIHHGEIPRERETLLQLPGIGPYTASAIQSFAFHAPVPAIDTNLSRVFQRYFGCTKSQVESRACELFRLKPRSGKTFNYALMDLGATVCVARSPRCEACPLKQHCHHRRTAKHQKTAPSTGREKSSRKNVRPEIQVGIACIHRHGKYLLGKRLRRKGGNWEFPGGKRENKESLRSAIKREVREELGIEVSVRPPFHTETFSDGPYTWRLSFSRCQILQGIPKALEHERLEWVEARNLFEYKMPKMNNTAVEKLQGMR